MSVIEFPGRGRSTDEIHAEAFRDLEHHIGDCVCMAGIAANRMSKVDRGDEELAFSVFHLTEMLLNLEKYYKAAWDGEDALTYRLITHPARTSRETKEACSEPPPAEPMTGDEFKEAYLSLPHEMRQVVSSMLRRLIEAKSTSPA
jgi:hypothetical protein